jgi:hypothetical protein
VLRDGGGRKAELALNGDRVSVGEDEKILNMGGGDGCTLCDKLNATELYT